MRKQMEEYVKTLQLQIVSALETLDQDHPFLRDNWTRAEGGYGLSCVASGGKVLEKAGVNISVIDGTLPPLAVKQMRINHQEIPEFDPEKMAGRGLPFFAAGLSLVIHPKNPKAPTVHANYRYFEITKAPAKGEKPAENPEVLAWWFGGGSDLTPSYLYEEDAVHFHTTIRDACYSVLPPEFKSDKAQAAILSLHAPFKRWCDEYFHIPHRGECRGLGGFFFDDLNAGPHARLSDSANEIKPSSPEDIFSFIKSCGDSFVESYVPILSRRMNEPFTDENRRWQLIRRGRYVEFNLVYDRGTKFGLATPNARIESILMSLPETARWEYMTDMGAEGTEEGRLVEFLKKPKDWV